VQLKKGGKEGRGAAAAAPAVATCICALSSALWFAVSGMLA